ncbi:tubulin monoglutamylase TTLL4 isoform X2 [Anopheles aquasalis]|uniref:tubulin monoglutamylase TTLL4 isoform X2 n=1 Tax=Anopheles aquasalis TaxID=42839 RepID=UPI00215B02EA|nr:tubulin monoglutamylase TTLL4 isoform X2 [Anopheles aquasalis]
MACHANLSCVCTYITTKFATIMDFKQNGGGSPSSQQSGSQPSLVDGVLYGTDARNGGNSAVRLHSLKQQLPPTGGNGANGQSTTVSSSSTGTTGNASHHHHHPSLRRRCRSESLPMAPLLYGAIDHHPNAQHSSRGGGSKSKLLPGHSHHHLGHQRARFGASSTGSAATTTSNALHDPHAAVAAPAGGLFVESFSLQQQHAASNNTPSNGSTRKIPLSLPTHDLLPSIGGATAGGLQLAKENVAQNGVSAVNAKDLYMSELDGYKKDRRSGGYYVPNEWQLESRFARNLELNFSNRASILERGTNRKLRPRRESEPQEVLYHSAHGNANAAVNSLLTGRITTIASRDRFTPDNTLKRSRDTISPTMEADESMVSDMYEGASSTLPSSSVSHYGSCQKDSPPSKMVNAVEKMDVGSETVTSRSGKISPTSQQRSKLSKTNTGVYNGRSTKGIAVRANRIATGRLKPKLANTLTCTGATMGSDVSNRKSVSPQPGSQRISSITGAAGTASPTPSGVSIGTSGGESVHTQDLDAETIDQSDAGDDDDDDLEDECNGEDDDLDDEIPISGDDVLEDSLTDSEDNYRAYLAATYQKPKSQSGSPPPAVGKAPLTSVTSIGGVVGGYAPDGPLAPSLFPHVPPYLSFATHDEKGPPMPPSIHKVLKWKLTLITPIVVRKVLINSGFRLLKKTNDWVGIWGKHMKSALFKTLRPYQKFNHLPGSFQIGRKDRVWRNLQTQMNRHGKKEFGFMPRTYIIPQDLKMLRQLWPRYNQRNCKWIIKPPASARGTGIKVVNRWSQIPKRKPLIVQRYIERPLLINGSKFDLRLYVLVTSMNPLRVYMHTDGLARFASVKYSEKSETLSDRYMHLTNYSINKLSNNYTQNEDADACQGHKWTIKSLWSYFIEQGVNVDRLWSALRNLVLRTVLAGEGPIHAMSKVNVGSRYNCYELFGIDVLLDSELVPWLLEVNISPSLHSASSLDLRVKGPLVKALLNTVMYQIPPRIPMAEQKEILKEQGLEGPLCFDKRIYTTGLSKAERLKHNQFIQKDMAREDYMSTILEDLTPDDVRCLLLTEDELARSAPLERILPAPHSHRYIGFTEHPRYYNRLLDAWEHRYSHNRAEGIALLQSLCEKKVHLQVPPSTLKKDCNNERPMDGASSENGSQDSGIHTDQTSSSELPSQDSSSVYQSQESIDQLPEDTPRHKVTASSGVTVTTTSQPVVIRAIYPPGSDNLLSTQTIEIPVPITVPTLPLVSTATDSAPTSDDAPLKVADDDDSDGMRLGDKIKLILDDALLLKQQECGAGDTENTIIVQD